MGSTCAPLAAFSGNALSRSDMTRAASACAASTRNPVGQTTGHEDGMRAARELRGAGAERRPDLDLGALAAVGKGPRVSGSGQELQHAEVRAAPHHADDGMRLVVEPQRGADGRRIARELAFPERLADEDPPGASRHIVRWREAAAGERAEPEHRQEIVGDAQDWHAPRIASRRREVHLVGHQCRRGRETTGAFLDVEIIRKGGGLARRRGVAIRLPDHHQPVGVRERRPPEQHGVDHAEDGGVGADAEAEGDDAGERELRILEEGADGEPEVVQHLASLTDGSQRPGRLTADASFRVLERRHESLCRA